MRLLKALIPTILLVGLFLVRGVAVETQAQLGSWGPVLDWGYQAKHMAALPSGKVLVFRTGDTARIWDPASGNFTMAPALFGDLHCAIQLTLGDGRVIVVGGQMDATHIGTKITSIFDPSTNTWTEGAKMNYARWYPTATPLGNGDILVTNGDDDHGNRVLIPEVYNPATNTWRQLTTASRDQGLYSFVYQLPNGKVYEAAPSANTAYLDVSGTGAWTKGPASQWSTNAYSESGAMYLPGKIMRTGGGDPAAARTAVIDMNVASPQWRETSPMGFARRRMNLVILADGTIMAVGGTRSGDDESAKVLQGEIWNPATEQWTTVASMTEARMYHSAAVLLADGRVVSGGGEAGGRNHAQIYSPPYLFKGARPTITAAPGSVAYGASFVIQTPSPSSITSVALLRTGAPTHAIDMNQRYVPLVFSQAAGGVNVTAPPNGNHTPPGIYMLIIKNSTGVPSVANWIRIGGTVNTTPGSVTGRVTDATTGAGIASATVHFGGGTTTTDPNGEYALATVAAGQHTFTVSASGYAAASKSATVSAGQASTLNFALVEPGSIAGQVVDALGMPIPGATISFAGGSTTTNATGEYTVTGIASGSQLVTASATSFTTGSQTLVVPPNATATGNFTLDVAPSYIAGEVVNAATNAPIEGATVSYSGGSTITDRLGRYRLENAPLGPASVTAAMPGYVGATQEVEVPYANYATSDFDLTPLILPPPPPSVTRIKDITFEGGSLTDALTGFDKAGTGLALVTSNALKGTRSGTATSGYFEEDFAAADDFYLVFHLRVNAFTSGTPRMLLLSNGGTTVGNLLISTTGLRLRNGSTNVGAESGPLTVGQIYRVGLHQKKGTGSNAVLEAFLAQGDTPFTTPFASLTSGTWKTPADRLRVGNTNGNVNLTLDDVRLDSGAMPGAAAAPVVPLTADFVANLTSGTAPLTVVFNSSISTGNVSTWAWDVNSDGTNDSTVGNPTVVYNAAGTYSVTLTVSSGGALTATKTRTAYITVAAPSPTLGSFSPTSGPAGTQVTLTGTNLGDATAVTFNNVPATTFSIDSATQIRATVPTGTPTGLVRVLTPAGTATSSTAFTLTTTPPPPTGPLTTTLVADAQVNKTSPTKNEGTITTLRTREGDSSNQTTYNSYLKFDVTGLTGNVTSAKLRLYATDANSAGVLVYSADSGWAETTITWNTRPLPGAQVGSAGAIVAKTWVEITLPPGLFTGNQSYTLVVVGRNTQSEYFGSREGTASQRPQLVLTVGP